MDRDNDIYFSVYLGLVALTILTVGTAQFSHGRIIAVSVALAIASMKAAMIALYFMHLRHERPLIYGIVLAGLAAVVILTIGIMPDALRL